MTEPAQHQSGESWRHTRRWFPNHPELGAPGIGVDLFLSDEEFALERSLLWPRVWLMVGRVEEIGEPGDFFVKQIPPTNTSLLIVRGRDHEIRAFHNVCTHRGTQLCWAQPGEKGAAFSFKCPFHGFTFDIDGQLKFVPDEANFYQFDKATMGLHTVATEIWAGFIFVHLEPNPAESLSEYLGDVGDLLKDHPFHEEPRYYEYTAELTCNWKVLLCTFLESYHAQALHAHGRRRTFSPDNPYARTESIILTGKHRMIKLYRNPNVKPTRVQEIVFSAVERLSGGDKQIKYHNSFNIHNIFPNFQLNVFNGSWVFHQYWPLSKDRVAWVTRTYFRQPRNASERAFQEYARLESRDPLMEDAHVSERQQSAMSSGPIERWVLSDEEVAIQHYAHVLATYTHGNAGLAKGKAEVAAE